MAINDLSQFSFVQERVRLLPYAFVKQKQVLPVAESNGMLLLATLREDDIEVLEEVRYVTGKEIQGIAVSKAALDQAIAHCYQPKENKAPEVSTTIPFAEQKNREGEYDLLDPQDDALSVRMVNAILLEAIQQKASDVHFEPFEHGLSVRYRIDGVLQKRDAPPREYQAQIISRIKVLARLDVAEHRLPQDGRIKLRVGEKEIDFRVSTIPVVYGERVTLRILDKTDLQLGFEQLGMQKNQERTFVSWLKCSEGMILVTGPTGSGKTTTLYSALSSIANSATNVMTIEDPVEYKLQNIAQMGVQPKIPLTFAIGLRAILRQDPDVIMIGEIRDRETAEIAIQAALTGHLVLSTLHTNDAASAIVRLVDMGIEPYLLSSTLIGVVAQRLVRKNCPHCKASYSPSDQELKELGLDRSALIDGVLYRSPGCAICFHTGYKGRSGIYEIMPFVQELKQQLLKSPDAWEMEKVARSCGIPSLREEGAAFVLQGGTSTSEILRMTRKI